MNCSAFVVGGLSMPTENLLNSARIAGFKTVRTYDCLAAVEQALANDPACFILFAPQQDVASLTGIVGKLRACKRRDVRFLPLVYFCQTGSREAVRAAIALGFDDVMAMPFTQTYFEERLAGQMNRVRTYCDAPDYFGPASHGRLAMLAHKAALEAEAKSWHFVRFVRSFSAGVRLIG